MINIPDISWLVNEREGWKNCFSGSLGTTQNGCLTAPTFNYRVYVNDDLIAECFIIQPWHLGGQKINFARAEFECSDKGVKHASEWLSDMVIKYGF